VGEIGRDRKETLYEMTWVDMLLIIRGYRRRNTLQYQLQRITAYSAFFAMRETSGKTPADWLPLYTDEYIQEPDEPAMTADEVAALQAEMVAINSRNEL